MVKINKTLIVWIIALAGLSVSENLNANKDSKWANNSENQYDTWAKEKSESSLDSFFADKANYDEYLANIRTKDLKIPEIIIKKSWAKLPTNLKSWNVNWMPRDLFNTSPSLYNLILSGNVNVHSDIFEYFQLVAEGKRLAAKKKLLDLDTKWNLENAELANSIVRGIEKNSKSDNEDKDDSSHKKDNKEKSPHE